MTKEHDEWKIPQTDGPPEREETEAPTAPERYAHLPLENQVNALLGDLEDAQRQASDNLEIAQRAQADLVNFRRRADEERLASARFSNSRLLAKLLPVHEELDLAISHAQAPTSGAGGAPSEAGGPNSSWLEGVMLIQRKLLNLLESEGVVPIECLGAMFNPEEHEALGTEETSEHPSGHVTQVVRGGYRLHDRVIQPAQVIVAR